MATPGSVEEAKAQRMMFKELWLSARAMSHHEEDCDIKERWFTHDRLRAGNTAGMKISTIRMKNFYRDLYVEAKAHHKKLITATCAYEYVDPLDLQIDFEEEV